MDFHKLVTEARSCRRFDASRELEPGFLRWLVDCVRICPCTANAQVMRYMTVQAPDKRAAMYDSLVWAAMLKDWDGPAESERPTGYVVFFGPTENGKLNTNTCIDIGIMGQTMQLAASSKGVDVCMFRSFKAKNIAEFLPTPEGYEVALVVAFGYGVEERRLAPVAADGSTKYYRDENGVHYVPKRALADVLLGEY